MGRFFSNVGRFLIVGAVNPWVYMGFVVYSYLFFETSKLIFWSGLGGVLLLTNFLFCVAIIQFGTPHSLRSQANSQKLFSVFYESTQDLRNFYRFIGIILLFFLFLLKAYTGGEFGEALGVLIFPILIGIENSSLMFLILFLGLNLFGTRITLIE